MRIARGNDASATVRAVDAAAAKGQVPLDINRNVAEASVRFFDREDHTTFTSHLRLVAGGVVGARTGYDTLRDALVQLGGLTSGDVHAAAVVFERAGRFYGHLLKARDLEQGVRAPLRVVHFETDAHAATVELRTRNRFERVRAIVDGAWTHRFRR